LFVACIAEGEVAIVVSDLRYQFSIIIALVIEESGQTLEEMMDDDPAENILRLCRKDNPPQFSIRFFRLMFILQSFNLRGAITAGTVPQPE
jgi:citrate synthase